VVVGDIMVLQEGDRVAADAAVLESVNLMVDESLLTGESQAVTKSVWDGKRLISEERPGGDNLAFVYSGTLVTRGHGLAKVVSTGLNTEMGKIGKTLQVIGDEDTLLKKKPAVWSSFLAASVWFFVWPLSCFISSSKATFSKAFFTALPSVCLCCPKNFRSYC